MTEAHQNLPAGLPDHPGNDPQGRRDNPQDDSSGTVPGRLQRNLSDGGSVGNKWWTLVAVCLGTFMLLLDITIVNVALPDIQLALHSSFSGSSGSWTPTR